MPNGRDTLGQAFQLALLEACRNTCKCTTCLILRKASRLMAEQFLKGIKPPSGPLMEGDLNTEARIKEAFTLEEEE